MAARKIALVNIAGGVGKTTTAVNLGASLADLGKRVLIVDLDPQANATSYIGTEAKKTMAYALVDPAVFPETIAPSSSPGVDLAHGSLETSGAELQLAAQPGTAATRLRKALRQIVDQYDYILIDAPPAPGLLTINAIAAADELIVPVETKPKALDGVGIMRELLEQITGDEDLLPNGPPRCTYLATRHDARTVLDRDCLKALRADADAVTFETVIRINQRVPESYAARRSILAYDTRSNGSADYRALAKEVAGNA